MENKVLGVVITDGVGYRNFVMSLFVEEAAIKFEKVVIYSGLPIRSYNLKLIPDNVIIIDLPLYKESKKVWFFRKLKEVAHMYKHRSFYGINDNLTRGYPKNNSPRSILIKLAYLISKVFHSENAILAYENQQFKAFSKDAVTLKFEELLKNQKLDVLFFTHQRPPFLAPLLYLAQKLDIKTNSFIFSWDNLASKGRMLGEFDGYLVWSELMKKELLHFYPNTKDNNISVVGTPQFEPYTMDKYFLSRDDFFKKFNLDLNKKVICYSCADADIGRNDEIHIRSILNYIEGNKSLQLFVRTSPAEDGKRFKKLMDQFPEIKWNFPKWEQAREGHTEAWSQRLPSVEDVIDLKASLNYSDVNINMLSTMSLDFMLFDKPVINTVFGNKNNKLYNDQRFLNYVHYDYVIKSKAVTIAKNETELHLYLSEALSTPEYRKEYRAELLKLEIGKPLEGTSKRIVEALQRI